MISKQTVGNVTKNSLKAVLLFILAFIITMIVTLSLTQLRFAVAPDVEIGLILWGVYFVCLGIWFSKKFIAAGAVVIVAATYGIVLKM